MPVAEELGKRAVLPQNVEEAAELIRGAAAAGESVAFWGSGTFQELGNAPKRVDKVLGTRRLAGIIEHEPADLTVTLGAGTTFQEADDHLKKYGQRLPWEAPFPERTTIGGAIAANVSGPARARWGTARDFLIGVRILLADGSLVKSGGKVTKNVTGYDLKKLFIGSLGTLGLVTEATLKVVPRPAATATVNATFSSPGSLFLVLASPELPFLFPEAIDFWRRPQGPWGLSARFTGTPEALKRQTGSFLKLCGTRRPETAGVVEGEEEARWWDRLIHAPWKEAASAVRFRFSVAPTEAGRFASEALRIFPKAFVCGRAVQGTGWIMIPAASEPDFPDFGMKDLVRLAQTLSGTLFLESCPDVWKEKLDVWLTPLPEAFLFARIKKAFDPQGVFSPGRFAGKI